MSFSSIIKSVFLNQIIAVDIQIINKSKHPLPNYQTQGASGLDLQANIEEAFVLKPLERKLVPTGLFMEIPMGIEAQVRPRSGLALKKGITVLNTPGTIDADYRGEIGVILINLSKEDFLIQDGERIAQMVFAPITKIEWKQTQNLLETQRGTSGFGHTGV